MDPAHVKILLAVWERTLAPLRVCRAILEENDWNAPSARATLDAVEVVTASAQSGAERTPSALIARYKELARKHGDVVEGTLPRSIVWVTEKTSRTPLRVAPWERHRSFLGGPSIRGIIDRASHDAIHWGGSMRIARDASQLPSAPAHEEALLALYDVRWALDHMTRFSRRAGTRVAVELRGVTGFVDCTGPDEALENACARFLDVAGVGRAQMKSAFDALDADAVHALLDKVPERRKNVPDCVWGAVIDANLRRTSDVLRDVDLQDDASVAGRDAIRDLASALASRSAHGVTRSRYATNATFPDVLDRLLVERDAAPIGGAWREVSREEATATWHAALTHDLAYGTPKLPPSDAGRVIDAFVASFDRDALFFRNGTDSAYHPILGSTFEQGAVVIDATSAGYLFVGDED